VVGTVVNWDTKGPTQQGQVLVLQLCWRSVRAKLPVLQEGLDLDFSVLPALLLPTN
jgi:hypothetical protein